MTRMKTVLCPLVLAVAAVNAQAQEDISELGGLWAMSLEELGQIRLTTLASGTATPLDKAAAIVTVVTDDDIKAMGATDLDEILETIPGIHVGRHDQTLVPKYIMRGVTSQHNPQILVLINGVPISSLFTGHRTQVWGGMPVSSIARVEVIRGPGSSLYGADAFAGVINIITKNRKDIPETVVGVRAGSFDTQSYWMETATSYDSGLDIGVSGEYKTTKGWRGDVPSDVQTMLDGLFGSSASRAPGKLATGVDSAEFRLDMAYGDLRFRAGYQGRYDLQLGPGLSQALDPNGAYDSHRANTDITYKLKDVLPKLDIETRTSYYYNTQEVAGNPQLFPPGTAWPDLSNPGELAVFNDGIFGTPEFREEQARIDINGNYRGFDAHIIRAGTGFFWGDIYETREKKNFDIIFTPAGPLLQPKPEGLIDVTDTAEVYLPEKDRTSYYAYIQDEWQFVQNWQLTSGIRYDKYSDFGETVNPRLALIWATTDTVTTKWLYGRAFRAPSFVELFATSNPVVLGNKNLRPETIDTYEMAISHQPIYDLRYSVNVFYYKIKDFIAFVPGVTGNVAQNVGERSALGGEFEIEYSMGREFRVLGNYATQRAVDDRTDKRVGEAPNHQVYGRVEWRFMPNYQFATQANWVGKQLRAASDARTTPVDDYTTIDFTLRRQNLVDGLHAAFSIRNAFNESVYEPSPVGGLPNDFRMAGRSVYGELSYAF